MSVLKDIFTGIIKPIIDTVKGASGSITDLILNIALKLPELIGSVKDLIGGDAEAKIDEALEAFDEFTGIDDGALDLIKDMPADKEEETWDALKVVIGNIAKCKAKISGYYVEE